MRKRTGKAVVVLAIVVILLMDTLIAFYFIVNGRDIINYLTLNSPIQRNNRYVMLDYPPPPSTSTVYVAGFNSTIQFDIVRIFIQLFYNGTLTEGQPVEMFASGSFIRENISLVSVGYEEAEPYGLQAPQPWLVPLRTVRLLPRITDQFGNATPNNDYFIELQEIDPQLGLIEWPVQGDYYPIIQVLYQNFTQVTQAYTDNKVHVSSADVVQQEQEQRIYNKLSLGLTVAVFAFAFVGSFDIIIRLYRLGWREKNSKSKQNTAHNPRTYSNHWQPIKKHR